jgi:hypothetical protein
MNLEPVNQDFKELSMTLRFGLFAIGIAAGVTFLACAVDRPTSPTESQFAKGGNKGKPGVEPQLMEYWIFRDASGTNLIHAAGTGDVDSVNANVVFDNFFNGNRDGYYRSDDHYEYQYVPPLPFPVEQTENGWHADIPWNGEREFTPTYPRNSEYHDALITDVDGEGADPFAFSLRFVYGPNVVGGMQPQGVYVGGVGTGEASATVNSEFSGHGEQNVTSYAVYHGESHTGTVTIVSVSVTGISCKLTQYREGKGKNAVWIRTRTVTADYNIQIAFGQTPGPIPPDNSADYAWAEFHFLDGSILSEESTDRVWEPDGVMTGTASLDLPDGDQDFNVAFAVDYVYPIGPLMDYAYDPSNNSNNGFTTTAGFGGAPWTTGTTQTAVDAGQGHFPVATTPAVPVSCVP